jgi:hypothetical protein
MSWLTRGTNSAGGLTTWTTGQVPTATEFNAPGLDLRTWGYHVDAGGYQLNNCAAVTLVPATLPASPAAGMLAINASNVLQVYYSAAWHPIRLTGAWTAAEDAGGWGITNLGALSPSGGTLSVAGLLSVTAAAARQTLTSSTGTNSAFQKYANTGGNTYIGIENSAGGSLSAGSAAYSTVIAVESATSLHFGTNNTVRLTINSAGLIISSVLGASTARANNAAAAAAGLGVGTLYRNGADPDLVCVVH